MQKYIVTPTFPGECEFVPHEHGDVYLASDVDALRAGFEASARLSGEVIEDRNERIAELEKALRTAREYVAKVEGVIPRGSDGRNLVSPDLEAIDKALGL